MNRDDVHSNVIYIVFVVKYIVFALSHNKVYYKNNPTNIETLNENLTNKNICLLLTCFWLRQSGRQSKEYITSCSRK